MAHLTSIRGPVLQAPLRDVAVGERCQVYAGLWADSPCAQAEVIGITTSGAVLSLEGDSKGLSTRSVVVPTGATFRIGVDAALLGRLVDENGQVWDGGQHVPMLVPEQWRAIDGAAPDYHERVPVEEVFATGVRAIDALLTCGQGQRVGVFAPAGAGKTSLVAMLLRGCEAEVFVVALVGERGRELAEFLADGIAPENRARTVVVACTSDRPAAQRVKTVLMATTIAEYFRDAGRRVVLIVDSITRYARALREVALAAGEMPARGGYPASVLDALPRVLERAGATRRGSITAFYTVLVEDDQGSDPIGEEVRAILDGHIVLSRDLAGRGHYPPIDVLASVSRVAPRVAPPELIASATHVRTTLARLDELKLMIELGEYREGENPEVDDVLARKSGLMALLVQPMDEHTAWDDMLEAVRHV